MSSAATRDNESFVKRFKEVCGTSNAREIADKLNISYTAAKNYLQGRMPDARILLAISDETPYSIHWLLTGKGEKLVGERIKHDLTVLLENLTEIFEPEFLTEFSSFLQTYNSKKSHTPTDSPKTVILPSNKIRQEKVVEEESSDLPINPS